jgi:hypothetical protein
MTDKLYRNVIYGKLLWDQLNVSNNTLSAIPRQPHTKAGFSGVISSNVVPNTQNGGVITGKYIASLGSWGLIENHECSMCHEYIEPMNMMERVEDRVKIYYCPKCWEEKDMYTSKW